MENAPDHAELLPTFAVAERAATPAPRGARFGAAIMDLVLAGVIILPTCISVFVCVLMFSDLDIEDPATSHQLDWSIFIAISAGMVLYGSVEAMGKRTLGKIMFGLRIVASDVHHARRSYVRR